MLKTSISLLGLLIAFTTASSQPIDSGAIYQYNREFVKAARFYRTFIDTATTVHPHRRYQDACLSAGSDMKKELQLHYQSLLAEDTSSPMLNYLYGRCLECANAGEYFERALRNDKCYEWALNGNGACAFENGDFDRARSAFTRSIRCKPDFLEAYRNLAEVYTHQNKPDKTRAVYKSLVDRARSNSQVYIWLGDYYLEKKDYKLSRKAYRKAIDLGAGGPDLFFKAGYSNFGASDFAEAAKYYTKSITAGNQRYEVYYNKASVLELLNAPADALDNYQIAYEKKKDYKILYSMGNCAVLLGLHAKAVEWYQQFLSREPRSTEGLFGLANAYQMKKDYEGAIATYRKILSIDPKFAKAYYNLGSIYAYHVKDPALMQEWWGKYIQMFPASEDVALVKSEMKKNGGE